MIVKILDCLLQSLRLRKNRTAKLDSMGDDMSIITSALTTKGIDYESIDHIDTILAFTFNEEKLKNFINDPTNRIFYTNAFSNLKADGDHVHVLLVRFDSNRYAYCCVLHPFDYLIKPQLLHVAELNISKEKAQELVSYKTQNW